MIADGPRRGQRVAIDPAIPCETCRACRDGYRNLCYRIRFAGHGQTDGIRAGSPPFRADAADQARAISTPGTTWPATRATARPIPETLALPGSDATLTSNDASTVNAATGNHRHRALQRNAFLLPA